MSVVSLLFIYPFLHEAGHLIAAMISGAESISWEIFPTAHTDFLINPDNSIDVMFISLSGNIAPLIIVLTPSFKLFCLYYFKLTTSLLSAVTAGLSVMFIVAEYKGGDLVFDDAVRFVDLYPDLSTPVLFVLATELIVSVSFIIFTGPIERTTLYLAQKDAVEK